MSERFDVIVMGGGMVGAAIACGLGQAGFKVAVIEAQTVPVYDANAFPDIRVSAISYASEQILVKLGAWRHIPFERKHIYRRLAVNEMPEKQGLAAKLPDISTWARTEFDAAEIDKTHLGHIIENRLIQMGLLKALESFESVKLFSPVKAKTLNLVGETKSVELETGQVLEASLVIGADGAQSQVRELAGIGQYRERYTQQAFVATVAYHGPEQDITWQSFRRNGPLAFLPLCSVNGQSYASLVWYGHGAELDRLSALSDQELLQAITRAYPKELPPLQAICQRGRFPLYKSHAHVYCKPGVVLAGDAAHTINPLAGQGVNLGFMDAAVLIETLAQARIEGEPIGDLRVLSRYEKNRRSANQIMMNMMDVFYYGFENKHLPVRVARNLGLGIAQRFGFAKKQVLKYAVGASGAVPKLAKPV